jgi:sporulation protein YhbH
LTLKIEQDLSRFNKIVRGKIKRELGKFISSGELIGKQGKKLVSIPIPRIDIPHFKFTDKQQGGVGQGEGDVGDPVGQGDDDGTGQAGEQEGRHVLEVDITFEEMVELLGEELELPNIKPKSNEKIESIKNVYRGIRSSGPESLRHNKRTYKQALKRQIFTGKYDVLNPRVIPYKEDKRYRSFKQVRMPNNKAVIIYMMDVSGSMGNEQKEIVRLESFWLDSWLRSQYAGIETRYIIHDAVAREVDRDTFFHTRESGGTIISSAYKLCQKIIEADYDALEWNVYPFHFSDGDNWSANDTQECLNLLQNYFFKIANMFCYGQVESEFGSGQFLKDLKDRFGDEHDNLIVSQIENREGILKSIKDFLGKGK